MGDCCPGAPLGGGRLATAAAALRNCIAQVRFLCARAQVRAGYAAWGVTMVSRHVARWRADNPPRHADGGAACGGRGHAVPVSVDAEEVLHVRRTSRCLLHKAATSDTSGAGSPHVHLVEIVGLGEGLDARLQVRRRGVHLRRRAHVKARRGGRGGRGATGSAPAYATGDQFEFKSSRYSSRYWYPTQYQVHNIRETDAVTSLGKL